MKLGHRFLNAGLLDVKDILEKKFVANFPKLQSVFSY